jgi:hypothetical protein
MAPCLVLDSQADLQTVVADLLFGQYRHPRRVVAFNTADGWMRDISADIAGEALSCALETDSAPPGHRRVRRMRETMIDVPGRFLAPVQHSFRALQLRVQFLPPSRNA